MAKRALGPAAAGCMLGVYDYDYGVQKEWSLWTLHDGVHQVFTTFKGLQYDDLGFYTVQFSHKTLLLDYSTKLLKCKIT